MPSARPKRRMLQHINTAELRYTKLCTQRMPDMLMRLENTVGLTGALKHATRNSHNSASFAVLFHFEEEV